MDQYCHSNNGDYQIVSLFIGHMYQVSLIRSLLQLAGAGCGDGTLDAALAIRCRSSSTKDSRADGSS